MIDEKNMIKGRLEKILSTYNDNPKKVSNEIVYGCPKALIQLANIPDRFKVYGRWRTGNTAQVPWVGVFDRDITDSAQRGYYIAYLFNAKMQGVYLSLNQGWTGFQKQYKTKKGKEKIKETAMYCRKLLHSSLSNFSFSKINLDATSTLAKGYELGHICGKYYSSNNIPEDNVLANDLRELMGIYAELKGYLSKYNTPITKLTSFVENLDKEEELAEDTKYQENIQKSKPKSLPLSPQPKPPPVTKAESNKWKKDAGVARGVIEEKEYSCEYDDGHKTFIAKTTNNNYVEAHHLIPMKEQYLFEYSLDVAGNVISLCPNCHRLFHHAKMEEKNKAIEFFFENRTKLLGKCGINITIERLKRAYS